MSSINPSSTDAALEARWQKIRARLEPLAPLLGTQGSLEPKRYKQGTAWRVRWLETTPLGKRRRTLHLGRDPRLVSRVRELLGQFREQCRSQAECLKETLRLGKLILLLGTAFTRKLTPGRAAHALRGQVAAAPREK
jgi:hypothetical protein